MPRRGAGAVGEHRVGDGLRQEVRPLKVGPDQLLETLLGGVEQIGANARRAARVVDQRRRRAERADDLGDDAAALAARQPMSACT